MCIGKECYLLQHSVLSNDRLDQKSAFNWNYIIGLEESVVSNYWLSGT